MTNHSPQFVLHFATGSARFPLPMEAAQEWHKALETLLERLKAGLGASQRQFQAPVEFRCRAENVSLEMFCNPNIWPGPHAAKVAVTLKAEGLRLSTEVEFPRLQDDLSQYISQYLESLQSLQ